MQSIRLVNRRANGRVDLSDFLRVARCSDHRTRRAFNSTHAESCTRHKVPGEAGDGQKSVHSLRHFHDAHSLSKVRRCALQK